MIHFECSQGEKLVQILFFHREMDPAGIGAMIGVSIIIGIGICFKLNDCIRQKRIQMLKQPPVLVRRQSKINIVIPK